MKLPFKKKRINGWDLIRVFWLVKHIFKHILMGTSSICFQLFNGSWFSSFFFFFSLDWVILVGIEYLRWIIRLFGWVILKIRNWTREKGWGWGSLGSWYEVSPRPHKPCKEDIHTWARNVTFVSTNVRRLIQFQKGHSDLDYDGAGLSRDKQLDLDSVEF